MSDYKYKYLNELFINEKILDHISNDDVVSLHNHTIISDGKETLQGLVETYKKNLPNLLKNRKLIISPSDHDSIYPIHKKNLYIPFSSYVDNDLKEYAQKNSVYFMLSSEIKVQHIIPEYSQTNPVLFELLITNIKPSAMYEGPVYELLKKDVYESRENINILILEYVSKEVCSKISLDDIKKYVIHKEKNVMFPALTQLLGSEIYKNIIISRNHIANYLEDNGFVKDKKEAFDKYLNNYNLMRKGIPVSARPAAKKIAEAFFEIGAKIGISHLDKIKWDNVKPDENKKLLNKRHFKKLCEELHVEWIETYYPYEREYQYITTANENVKKLVNESASSRSWEQFAQKYGFVGMHGLDFHSRDVDILLLQIIDGFYAELNDNMKKEQLIPIIKNYLFKTKYYLIYPTIEENILEILDEKDPEKKKKILEEEKKKLEKQDEFLEEKAEIFFHNYLDYPDYKLLSKAEKLKQLFLKKKETSIISREQKEEETYLEERV